MVVTFVGCCPIFPATSRILGADGQTHSEKVYEKQAVILFHGVSLLCTAWNYICSFVLAQRITITLQLNRFVVVLFYRFPYVSLSRYPSNEILFFFLNYLFVVALGLLAMLYFISLSLLLYLFTCEEVFIVQHDSLGSQALEHRLSCGAWAELPCGMWDLPGPEMKPMSPASVGGFLASGP